MNRKMTLFAFALKCGFRSARGLRSTAAAWASFHRLARAIEPSPTAQSWKKCRRVVISKGFVVTMIDLPAFFLL